MAIFKRIDHVALEVKDLDFSMNPKQEIEQNFTIRMSDASDNGFQCNITLYDSELGKLDEASFNVTIKEAPKLANNTDESAAIGESQVTTEVLDQGNCPNCQGFSELTCMVWGPCGHQFPLGPYTPQVNFLGLSMQM